MRQQRIRVAPTPGLPIGLAGFRHFRDHIAPITCELGSTLYVVEGTDPTPAVHPKYTDVKVETTHKTKGVNPAHYVLDDTISPIIVAGRNDVLKSRYGRVPRPIIGIEHGSGIQWEGNTQWGNTSLAISLLLVPGERLAQRYRKKVCGSVVRAVGCAKMDPWHDGTFGKDYDPECVCISTHFDLRCYREGRTAWPEYSQALIDLAKNHKVIGHCHPRVWKQRKPIYEDHGIEPVQEFSEVLNRAGLYICDTSSTIYEFASLNRPVVVMNASWYRRDVNFGLRFWDDIPGIQADKPEALAQCVDIALSDPEYLQEIRRKAIENVYVACDGKSAERAANAIQEWQNGTG